MNTTFKYQNQIITTPNLEKKLKKMKLTLEDIEIISEEKKEEKEDTNWRTLYYFKNPKTGNIITSIYPNLDDLEEFINVNDYVKIENS